MCKAHPGCRCSVCKINTLLDQGSSTFKSVQRAKKCLSRECCPLLETCSPPNFANGLEAANSASSFRCLAPLSVNPRLILASCKVKMQIIRIQLTMTKYQGGGKKILCRLTFSCTEHLFLCAVGESVLVRFAEAHVLQS